MKYFHIKLTDVLTVETYVSQALHPYQALAKFIYISYLPSYVPTKIVNITHHNSKRYFFDKIEAWNTVNTLNV
jgi:hypothetical protein